MIDKENLLQSYKDIIKKFHEYKSANLESDELSYTIFSNEWITIFLIGYLKTNQIVLQVEISPKGKFRSLNSSLLNFKNNDQKTETLQKFLSYQIKSLEYLLKLSYSGFSLDFIGEEGIWFGIKLLENEPNEKLYENVTPP